jgi:hypothetical protein
MSSWADPSWADAPWRHASFAEQVRFDVLVLGLLVLLGSRDATRDTLHLVLPAGYATGHTVAFDLRLLVGADLFVRHAFLLLHV